MSKRLVNSVVPLWYTGTGPVDAIGIGPFIEVGIGPFVAAEYRSIDTVGIHLWIMVHQNRSGSYCLDRSIHSSEGSVHL
jgi:hypothetical protein